MTEALIVRGLTKGFRSPVISNLNLTIQAGEIYALLGPNGAGKTTTLRMIAGLLRPDAGSIEVFGTSVITAPLAAKAKMAWLPDEPLLYDKLSAYEYLQFVAGLWQVPPAIAAIRANELLEILGLWQHRNARCETFSRGMKQKTILASALIHDPKLLILDEPLTGLDAAAAHLVKSLLAERTAAGAAIIITTHILDVAERLANRIGILSGGTLLAEGDLTSLQTQASRQSDASLEEVFLHLTGGHA